MWPGLIQPIEALGEKLEFLREEGILPQDHITETLPEFPARPTDFPSMLRTCQPPQTPEPVP